MDLSRRLWTGYEPTGRQVTAVEPSLQMIRQRGAEAARVIQGCAEELPFDDDSFDASMAILTLHHYSELLTLDAYDVGYRLVMAT